MKDTNKNTAVSDERTAKARKLVEQHAWAFNTFGDAELTAALDAAKALALAMWLHEQPRWLSLCGKCGTGKTHLAKALLRFWRSKAGWLRHDTHCGPVLYMQGAQFIAWRALVSRLKSQGFSELQDLKEMPFVVLDDIGAAYDKSGFARAVLDELADARLGRWTVLTGNLSLQQIAENEDPRIASRMLRNGSVVVTLANARDYGTRKPRGV